MTKTFSATLVATELLLLELLGPARATPRASPRSSPPRTPPRRPSPPPSRSSSRLAATARRRPAPVRDRRRRSAYPAALEAALKLKEMALVHAEGAEVWEMTSGAATMLGPDAVVIALAPDGPARAGRSPTCCATPPTGAPGRSRSGRSRSSRRPTLLPLPADASEDHAPLSRRAAGRPPRLRARPAARRTTPTAPTGSSATTARACATSSARPSEEAVR